MFNEASELFIREMRLARKRLKNFRGFFEWLAHQLYDWLSKYGESIFRPVFWMILTVLFTGLYITLRSRIPTPFLENLGKVMSVFLQLKSFKDLGIADIPQTELLWLEIGVRAFSVVLLGNLFIALKRRLERK